jgi:hypothetical protein
MVEHEEKVINSALPYELRSSMIDKVKVPRKVYDQLMVINREIHYTLDYSQVIKKAEDNGFLAATEWLKNNEELYKRGFARGFEPAD